MSRTVRALTGAVVAAALVVAAAPTASARDFPEIDYRGTNRTVEQWQSTRIQGTTSGLATGTRLCLFRAPLGDTDARGDRLNICTTVNRNGTFRMRAQLGRVGTYHYQVLPVPAQRVNQTGLTITVR